MKKLVALGVLVLTVSISQVISQPLSRFLQDASLTNVRMEQADILLPSAYRGLTLDAASMEQQLQQLPPLSSGNTATIDISLPMPDGSNQTFRISRSQIMAPGLAAKFPEINTFKGYGIDDPTASMVLDYSPKGLHVMILNEEGTVLINPLHHQADDHYLSFNKRDSQLTPEYADRICEAPDRQPHSHTDDSNRDAPDPVGDNLVRYRIAIAASSAYTSYHGGTAADAIAAITTAINRITGVYEREMAITLELVADNDDLIYVGSDPFFNTSTTLGDNLLFLTDTIANRIGFNAFDIGHLFTRVPPVGGISVAGIAFRGVVCSNFKGSGISSLPNPIGDPFAIEVAAHEMGHQFNSPHGYNSDSPGFCIDQRSGFAAYEPGGGSTIMCYPGTCPPHNIQAVADDYFHSGSREIIIDFTRSGNGAPCGTAINNNNNTIPDVTVPAGGFFIPHSTPFELIGSGSDADGDALTYCWEEMDLGPGGHPDFPVGNAPIFRTFVPTSAPNRVFPRLNSIINNSTIFGELLPTYARDLTFHLTARDNKGGARAAEIEFKVDGNSGPFLVTHPNTFQIFDAESYLSITWDVANTDNAPVSAAEVDLFLSTDGGMTYPIQLADDVPNDGEQLVLLPDLSNNFCRVRIQAADNIFFDISNVNFGIQPTAEPSFSLYQLNTEAESCPGGVSASYTILTTSQGGFTDSIDFFLGGLPNGVSGTFTPAIIAPGDTCILTLEVTSPLATGDYDFFIRGFAGSQTSPQFDYTLEILDGGPPPATAINPLNGSPGASVNPTFVWDAIPGALSYDFEISASASFANPISAAPGLTSNSFSIGLPLLPQEVYYWRVVSYNICGASAPAVFAFKTGTCTDFTSTDVPKAIPTFGSPATITSTVNVSTIGEITDVNVIGLAGTHLEVNDLEISLTSPALGTEVVLFSGICGDGVENFSLNLDDAATDTVISCPPTSGGTYRPMEALSAFNGETPGGIWTLTISDNENFNGGNLTAWGLEICTSTNGGFPELITNQPLNISRWEQAGISQSLLNANDPTGAANTTFTLVSLPMHGGVLLNGVNIFPGATFTQEDIDNGALAYLHNCDSASTTDAFTFTVQNPNGGWLGTPAFQINITQTTSINPSQPLTGLKVFPNPVHDRLYVELEQIQTPHTWTVDLLTLQGQIVSRQQGNANKPLQTHFDVSELATGLYLIRVQTPEGHRLVKVSIH